MELLIIIFSSCGMNREQKMSYKDLGDNDLFPIILYFYIVVTTINTAWLLNNLYCTNDPECT